MKIEKFEGLVAAPFTPMDPAGKLNEGMIPAYYHFLERNGISGAFVNGSTGEGPSLSKREREVSAAAWAACRKEGGSIRLINLVGGTSCDECVESAVFSRESGFSAVAVLAPYYFKPNDAQRLAEFVTRVGEAVPDLPVYFYHIPALTGVSIPMAGFLELIAGMLPNFAGIKFTHEDFMDFLKCLNFRDGYYDILWGRDECLLSALVLGCKGAVGSTYNYAAPLYYSLIRAFESGDLDLARDLQKKSVAIVDLLGKYGGMGTGKLYMKYIGMDCGTFRLPVRNPDPAAYGIFESDVKQLGIDELLSK